MCEVSVFFLLAAFIVHYSWRSPLITHVQSSRPVTLGQNRGKEVRTARRAGERIHTNLFPLLFFFLQICFQRRAWDETEIYFLIFRLFLLLSNLAETIGNYSANFRSLNNNAKLYLLKKTISFISFPKF